MTFKISKTETITGLLLLLALVLPVATVVSALVAGRRLAGSGTGQNRSQPVLQLTAEVEVNTFQAGTALHAYEANRRPDEAARLEQLLAAAAGDLHTLSGLIGPEPEQRQAFNRLQAAFDARRAAMEAQRLAIQSGGRVSDADAWQSNNALQTAANQLGRQQRQLAAEQRQRALNFTRAAARWFYGSLLASLALLVGCFLALLFEVRRRRRAQSALADVAERHQQLIDNIPSVVWTMGPDGAPRFMSHRIEDLSGFSRAEVLRAGPQFWAQHLEADDYAAWCQALAELFEQGVALELHVRLRRRDGSMRWLQARAARVYGRDGKPLADGLFIDETEARRQAELEREKRELELRSHEAERASRLKSEFIANVSHELRTPLTSILGFSDLMMKNVGGTLSGSHVRFAAHIHEDGEYLLRLINDILDLSRIESGQALLQLASINVLAAAGEAVMALSPVAERYRLRVDCEVPPDLYVYADPLRLRQILNNLLSNSLKFTPEGGRVRLDARAADDWAEISVCDTGVGIALSEQGRIFEKFHQVGDYPHGKNEGSGLGLAITRQLVEMQGGVIRVESEPGKGSRFAFTLRRVAATSVGETVKPHWLEVESA